MLAVKAYDFRFMGIVALIAVFFFWTFQEVSIQGAEVPKQLPWIMAGKI